MKSFNALLWICLLITVTNVTSYRHRGKFPPGFKFGAATSAYQTEGSWNVSDKSESIWDRFTHTSNVIRDGSNGNVACNSYVDWKSDIQMAVDLGLDFYRFSISWTRLLPTGFPDYISKDGKRYYNKLIDGLLKRGVKPMVTLYHWDLPQRLQDLGGWTNPMTTDYFADYARVVYSLYADRVKTWITINEPLIMCDLAYNTGALAPGTIDPDFANYLCGKNTLIAHAKAWRIYDKEFRPKYHGQVSLANQLIWLEPATSEDVEITELLRQYQAGLYSHPIYSKNGGWPPIVEERIEYNSREEGYFRSKLPSFTEEEIDLVKVSLYRAGGGCKSLPRWESKHDLLGVEQSRTGTTDCSTGTYDFYGFNYYTSRLVRKAKDGEEIGPWPFVGAPEFGGIIDLSPDWKKLPYHWIQVFPEGMRRQMIWLREQYGDIPIFISENGYADAGFNLNDIDRLHYYKEHLKQVLLAINEDGLNITGFTAWTLMDNFEWTDGYTAKFGLYEVDFESPYRTRTPRKSAAFYKSVIRSRSIDDL